MNPLRALLATQEQYEKDPEIRRLRTISAGRTSAAVSFLDWDTRTPSQDDEVAAAERQALHDVWALCIMPGPQGGLNREARTIFRADDVQFWSRKIPGYAFFYADNDAAPVTKFVAGDAFPLAT